MPVSKSSLRSSNKKIDRQFNAVAKIIDKGLREQYDSDRPVTFSIDVIQGAIGGELVTELLIEKIQNVYGNEENGWIVEYISDSREGSYFQFR